MIAVDGDDSDRFANVDRLSEAFSKCSSKGSRIFVFIAGVGVGKAIFVAQSAILRSFLAAIMKFDFLNSSHCCVKRVIYSISRQMCEKIFGFREALCEILG